MQEPNPVIQMPGVALSVSVVKLSTESAQVIVVDPNTQTFTNLVCVMNLPGSDGKSKQTSTVLMDDLATSSPGTINEDQAEDLQTETSDLAKLIAEKVCQNTCLKQLFFSFSINPTTTLEYTKNLRLLMETEKSISSLVNSLEISDN